MFAKRMMMGAVLGLSAGVANAQVVYSSAAIGTPVVTSPATATGPWSSQLKFEKEHDFGTVARAAKVEHTFVIHNPTNQTIHIQSVRSSCGCTQPRVGVDTIPPGGDGTIIAAFNTRAFTGQRGARVTITLDRPNYTEIQVQVRGYIRTDVVVDPGQVSLGNVAEGQTIEQSVKINYAGRNDWKIESVKANSPLIDAKVVESKRGNGLVSYDLVVALKPGAPAGYIADELILVTNDRRSTTIPVKVDGLVVSNLTLSPSPLMLGTLQPGQTVTKQIVVKGVKPFKVTDIQASIPGFAFQPSAEEKAVHVIPVTFSATAAGQTLAGTITVTTSLEDKGVATTEVHGSVAAPLAGN